MSSKKTIVCKTIHGKEHEVPVGSLTFRPSAYGVIVQDDQALLSPQWDGYDFPGGGLELGETIEEGLIREVKEETGFDVEPKEILFATDDFFIHPVSKKSFHTILHFYRCEIVGGELSTEGFDEGEREYAQEARWVPVAEVDPLKFYNPVDSPALIRKAHSLAARQ